MINNQSHCMINNQSHCMINNQSHCMINNQSHCMINNQSHCMINNQSHCMINNQSHCMIKSIYCSCVNYSKPTVDLFSKVNGVMRGNKVSVEDGTAGGGGGGYKHLDVQGDGGALFLNNVGQGARGCRKIEEFAWTSYIGHLHGNYNNLELFSKGLFSENTLENLENNILFDPLNRWKPWKRRSKRPTNLVYILSVRAYTYSMPCLTGWKTMYFS